MSYKKIRLSHISLNALEFGHIYQYPIYYKENGKVFTILIDKEKPFDKIVQDKIDSYNIHDVFVKIEDHPQYEIDAQNYLKKIMDKKSVPIDLKSTILHEMASDIMNDLIGGELSSKKIQQASDIVTTSVDLLLEDSKAIKAMLKVTSHDYYTYTHSVNVSTYALGFGTYLKLPRAKIELLGMAGIMHDLGKKQIPSEIINKNGKLSDEEFELIKNHPTYGVDILKKLDEHNKNLLDVIEQHHEKIDGTGYPHGLKGNEINIFAQIMSIVDIFDALTTKRSYKDALNSFEAFDIMNKHMKDELNPKLLRKFITFMSL